MSTKKYVVADLKQECFYNEQMYFDLSNSGNANNQCIISQKTVEKSSILRDIKIYLLVSICT